MRSILVALTLVVLFAVVAPAETPRTSTDLLDRLPGTWVLEGMLAGKQAAHDVVATSVLNGQYVQLHELSRDRDAKGRPVYEAFVYLTWEPVRGEYSCQWLDSTGNTGLSNGVTCRAKPSGDDIRLLFKYPDGTTFHNHLRLPPPHRHLEMVARRRRERSPRPLRSHDHAAEVGMCSMQQARVGHSFLLLSTLAATLLAGPPEDTPAQRFRQATQILDAHAEFSVFPRRHPRPHGNRCAQCGPPPRTW